MKKVLKIVLLILFIFSLTQPVYAEVETQDRTTQNKLGVNKKWNIEGKENEIKKTPKVDASKKIYDFSNVLTDEEESILLNKINEYINKTGFDLVIVTYNLEYIIDSENEDFACDFYDYNDFGLDKENYSGTLLFRNTYEKNRYYDFYMFGNTQLYYQGSGRNDTILDGIYNDISNDNYLIGFEKYINYLTDYYEKGKSTELKNYEVDSDGYLYYKDTDGSKYYGKKDDDGTVYFIDKNHKKFYVNSNGNKVYDHTIRNAIIFSLIIGGVVSFIIIMILCKKNKMVRKEKFAYDYLDKNSFKLTKNETNLISSHTTHVKHTTSSGGSSGGFSSGGFSSSGGSSGGGHSSGGGRHG